MSFVNTQKILALLLLEILSFTTSISEPVFNNLTWLICGFYWQPNWRRRAQNLKDLPSNHSLVIFNPLRDLQFHSIICSWTCFICTLCSFLSIFWVGQMLASLNVLFLSCHFGLQPQITNQQWLINPFKEAFWNSCLPS